jgi:hypothetical protein
VIHRAPGRAWRGEKVPARLLQHPLAERLEAVVHPLAEPCQIVIPAHVRHVDQTIGWTGGSCRPNEFGVETWLARWLGSTGPRDSPSREGHRSPYRVAHRRLRAVDLLGEPPPVKTGGDQVGPLAAAVDGHQPLPVGRPGRGRTGAEQVGGGKAKHRLGLRDRLLPPLQGAHLDRGIAGPADRVGQPGPFRVPGRIRLVGVRTLGHVDPRPFTRSFEQVQEDILICLSEGSIGDHAAVRGPGRAVVRGRVGRQPTHVTSVGVHHVDIEIPISIRLEGDATPIGRPGGARIKAGMPRQPDQRAALQVQEIHIPVASSAGGKSHHLPIWRPGRVPLRGRVTGQSHDLSSGLVDGIDIGVAVPAKGERHRAAASKGSRARARRGTRPRCRGDDNRDKGRLRQKGPPGSEKRQTQEDQNDEVGCDKERQEPHGAGRESHRASRPLRVGQPAGNASDPGLKPTHQPTEAAWRGSLGCHRT